MQIYNLLDYEAGRSLLAKMGFDLGNSPQAEPMPPAQCEVKHIRPIRRFTRIAAQTIQKIDPEGRKIDVVVGTGYHPQGISAAVAANLAEDLERLQNGGGHVASLFACRENGKISVYLDGVRLEHSKHLIDNVRGKNMAIVASVLYDRSRAFRFMRGLIHGETQNGEKRSDLVRVIVAPVVRDTAKRLIAAQQELMQAVAPTCLTLAQMEIVRPRIGGTSPKSGEWDAFNASK